MTPNSKQAYLSSHNPRFWDSKAGHFLLHFLELQIAMTLGAVVCYQPGTFLFAVGDVFFLTVPVVTWMVFRGHSSRHILEMGVAMILPVIVIVVLGQLTVYDYFTWLLTAGYPAMSLGMLTYMLYRRDHFTGRVGRLANTSDSSG
jgi:hypothetical protein